MISRGQAATRQLAKRQMTWLRSERDCHWLEDSEDIVASALGVIERGLGEEVPG